MNDDIAEGTKYYYHGQDLKFSNKDQLQDIANNIDTYENNCLSNDNGASCALAGVFYTDGKSDHKAAIGFFTMSCILEYDTGCNLLGRMFEKGWGVAVDYQKAREAYELACQYSKGSNCDSLAYLYDAGLGVRQDHKKSHEINLKSCDLYNPASCSYIGVDYEFGSGVEKDLKKAKEYYGKSCDLGFQNGCDNYRRLNEQGH